MLRQAIVAVAVTVLFAAVPVFAQATRYGSSWVHIVSEDDFSGEREEFIGAGGDEVNVIVGCLQDEEIAVSFNLDDGIFHNGEIDLRWMDGPKDGEIESYSMADQNQLIYIDTTSNRNDVIGIISSLRLHSELRLRFRRWRNEIVTDRVSLNGSTRAIDALSCVGGERHQDGDQDGGPWRWWRWWR